MIPYLGGPVTPETAAVRAWQGGHAFVSWAVDRQIRLAASITQSFALDNGAFSFWGKTEPPPGWKNSWPIDWWEYYCWADEWLAHPACDWAIIPDVIDGSEEENDALLAQWPHGERGVPVWHLNESPERLLRLANNWPRIALGSTKEYDVRSPRKAVERIREVMPLISDERGQPWVKLHGLRMLRKEVVTQVPLSSADSTNVARNCGIDQAWKGTYAPSTREARVDVLRARTEFYNSPGWMDLTPPG